MSTVIDLMPRPEFEARLISAADEGDLFGLRLLRLLESGRCPAPVAQKYATSVVRGARNFIRTLTVLIDTAPDVEAKLILLENLMEEEGIALRRGHGLVVLPQRHHVALAERFAIAVGADLPDRDEAGGIDSDKAIRLAGQGRWVEAVSFLLVGQEAGFAPLSARMHAAFLRMGYPVEELRFFQVHMTADERHGAEALALVSARASSRAEQDAAILAAAAGRRDWLRRHGGEARAAA